MKRKYLLIILLLLFTLRIFAQESAGGGEGQGSGGNGGGEGGGTSVEAGGTPSEGEGEGGDIDDDYPLNYEDGLAQAAKEEEKSRNVLEKMEADFNEQKKQIDKILDNNQVPEDVKKVLRSNLSDMEKQVDNARADYEQKVENRQKAAEAYSEACKKVSDQYKEIGYTGDPVQVATGDFVFECVDYEAQDYGEKFLLLRNYKKGAKSSFGNNWTCSLDSRIIRCRKESVSSVTNAFDSVIDKCNDMLEVISDYARRYPQNSDAFLPEVSNIMSEKLKYDAYKRFLEQIETKNNKADSLNKYAAYGQYANLSSRTGWFNQIIFIEEDGTSYPCFYESAKGCYSSAGKISGSSFKIYGRLSNGNTTYGECYDGGFVVAYKNGTNKYFDKFGILEKTVDSNGNTTLFEHNKGKISKITNKTGEVLNVLRNSEGYITSITGNTSGISSFTYVNHILTTVTNNIKESTSFSYDNNYDLLEIAKPDGSLIKLTYEYYSDYSKKMVTAVTNGMNQTEKFDYDKKNKLVCRTSYDGKKEYHYLDENNCVVKHIGVNQDEEKFWVNTEGLLQKKEKNGRLIEYEYDKNLLPVKLSFDDGSTETWNYDDCGRVVYICDQDGFSTQYIYDEKGNVIETLYCNNPVSKMTYYDNGLVKTLEEAGYLFEYYYNDFGSPVKKVTLTKDNVRYEENWNYDEKNRVIKYIDSTGGITEILYENNKQIEKYSGGLIIEKTFDELNRCVEEKQTDLITNQVICKQLEYDKLSRVSKLYFNNKLYAEYEYTDGNKHKKIILHDISGKSDDTEVQEYFYDSRENLTGRADSIETTSFEYSNNKTLLTVNSGTLKNFYQTDENGRLVEINRADGSWEKRTYSSGGRLIKTVYSKGNTVSIFYNKDGTKKIETLNDKGSVETCWYNSEGYIERIVDFNNAEFAFYYDDCGNLIKKTGPAFYTLLAYDKLNRLVSEKCYENNNLIFENYFDFDDERRSVTTRRGSGNNCIAERAVKDAWNRVIKTETNQGTTEYFYNETGSLIKEKDCQGYETFYEYSPSGKLLHTVNKDGSENNYVYDDKGFFLSGQEHGKFSFNNIFNDSGFLIREEGLYGAWNNYNYDQNGRLSESENYATGKYFYTYEDNGQKLTKTDGKNYVYKNFFDKKGNLIKETNNSGKSAEYAYDEKNRLALYKDFSGKTKKYKYVDSTGMTEILYENGSKEKIEKNPLGFIKSQTSGKNDFSYEYNTAGQMTQCNDICSGVKTDFFYDEKGNCIEKKGDFFDYCFEYDIKSRISSVYEKNSGVKVSFEYDENNLEVKRVYSNGITLCTFYNEKNQAEGIIVKEPYGVIIFAQYYLYDEKGRVRICCNHKGEIKKYTYDDRGRLYSYECSYENTVAAGKKYSEESGITIKNNEPEGTVLKLSNEDYSLINSFFQKNNCLLMGSIIRNQYSWKEVYEYTPSGSLLSETNPFGTIIYEYDSENRLNSKHGSNSKEQGIFYYWDDNGNLEKISAPFYKCFFYYETKNRPWKIREENLVNGTVQEFYYEYDVLGRRIAEQSSAGSKRRFVYDGLTSNLIEEIPVFENNYSVTNYQLPVNNLEQTNEEYRLLPSASKVSQDSSVLEVKDFVPVSNLHVNEKNVIRFSLDSSSLNGIKPEVILQDINSSCVLAVTDNDGSCKNVYEYSPWGQSYSVIDNLQEANSEFSYSKIRLSTTLPLYDMGNRDYCPSMKSFTSVDPVKDGDNWYAFCPGDPVNYKDRDGLRKNGMNNGQWAAYCEALAKISMFDGAEYKETGESCGIPSVMDCADTSSTADMIASKAAGYEITSKKETEFAENMENGNTKAAQNSVQSVDFSNPDNTDSYRQVVSGYNRDYLRYYKKQSDAESKEAAAAIKEQKKETYENLSDPENISPGSVLVWEKTDKSPSQNWVGHTATVLARDFDEDGNVVGIAYMEGHTGGGKTYVGYMSFSDSNEKDIYTIDSWMGDFKGVYEIEPSDTAKCTK